MTYLFDLTSLADHLSGIERYAANIAYEFIKKNKKNEYILIFKERVFSLFKEYSDLKNIKIIIMPKKNKLYFMQVLLPLELYKHKADCYLFLAFPAPLLFFNRNAISAIHDVGCWDCPESMKFLGRLYFKILNRKAAWGKKKIVTVSFFSKRRICKILNKREEDVWVIYDGISEGFNERVFDVEKCEIIRKKYNLSRHYILSLSTLEPRKNLELLVKAYINFSRKDEISLVIAGRKGWKMESFLKNIDKNSEENIIVTGFVEDIDLPYVYHMADVFVFPSKYEGFGLPPLEAMNCGTVVISSNAASMPEILEDAAIFFENDNIDDLIEKIEDFYRISNKNKEEFILKGRLRGQKFSWTSSAEELAKEIEG